MIRGRRIIGFGNPNRGDDAAGLLVARRLRELGVESEESGDPIQLIESWRDANVVVIDAAVTGARPGTIKLWKVSRNRQVTFDTGKTSTHGLGVAQAIELSRTLNRLPRHLEVYGIEGNRFDVGTPPSAEVCAAVERLARRLARQDLPHASPS